MVMLRRILLLSLVATVATGVAVLPASAQRGRDPFSSQWDDKNQEQQRDVPLNSVIRDLKRQYGGQHLDAQKIGNRYVIAWITEEGKRLTIEVDAATGRTISVR
jgi:uncharacterized membrane protein YkoI